MSLYQTCRFCKDFSREEMVQYGVRHYAHHECYLKAGKKLDDLQTWQIGLFPYKLLAAYRLTRYVEKRMAQAASDARFAKRGVR